MRPHLQETRARLADQPVHPLRIHVHACARGGPSDVAAYANRGDAWSGKGNFDHAIVDYDAAVRLKPNDAHAYNHRGKAYFDKGDADRAIADYDEAIRLNPRYAHAYENRGEAWNAKGDYARSIAVYDAAMRLNTSNAACAPEAGRVIECIKPSATDPAIHRFDNPSYVIFNDNSGPGANLLVFLPGTNGRPPGPVRFLMERGRQHSSGALPQPR